MTDFAALRQRMVDNQLRTSEVTDRRVIAAFLEVPRENFVAPAEWPFAYADRELKIAASAPERRMMVPVTLARLIQALLDAGNDRNALVVGCGSGYSAAIMARLFAEVAAVEEDLKLAQQARESLSRLGIGNVSLAEGRLVDGDPQAGRYDAILVDGSVEVMPPEILAQLKSGGLLSTVERDERVSRALLYERIGEETSKWPLFDAWAPPLPGFERRREFVF
jgi:protein-L-isoaspartate(D-aspartate) O-methyltransferase